MFQHQRRTSFTASKRYDVAEVDYWLRCLAI